MCRKAKDGCPFVCYYARRTVVEDSSQRIRYVVLLALHKRMHEPIETLTFVFPSLTVT
jgi:hypothetical protein